MDWEKATKELQKKLDPKHVKTAEKVFGAFIEGWHAIDEANRIFGYGNWSYEINTLVMACQPTTNEKGNHSVTYQCQIKVSVGGVVREDVGYGSGHSKNIGDAHESAGKEAVTDALKRALRTFGNPFGLALYDKTKSNVGVDPISAAEKKRVWEEYKENISTELLDCKSSDDCRKVWTAYWRKFSEHQMQDNDWKSVLTAHVQPVLEEFTKVEEKEAA